MVLIIIIFYYSLWYPIIFYNLLYLHYNILLVIMIFYYSLRCTLRFFVFVSWYLIGYYNFLVHDTRLFFFMIFDILDYHDFLLFFNLITFYDFLYLYYPVAYYYFLFISYDI